MLQILKGEPWTGLVFLGVFFGCGCGPALDRANREAIEMLKEYTPSYKLDKKGRVVDLKLQGDVKAEALDAVAQLKEMRRLSLYGAGVNDASLGKLQALKWLEDLTVRENSLTDDGLEHLEKLSRLRFLTLRPNGKLTEKRAASLQKAIRQRPFGRAERPIRRRFRPLHRLRHRSRRVPAFRPAVLTKNGDACGPRLPLSGHDPNGLESLPTSTLI